MTLLISGHSLSILKCSYLLGALLPIALIDYSWFTMAASIYMVRF